MDIPDDDIYTVNNIEAEIEGGLNVSSTLDREQKILEDCLQELSNGDIFWDVGACYGEWSIFPLLSHDIECVSVEPSNDNAAVLKSNLVKNDVIERTNIIHYPLLEDNVMTKFIDDKRPMWRQVHEDGSTEMMAQSVDNLVFVGDYPPPDVMKIDTEGAEMRVLHGMDETLKDSLPRVIYLETHTTVRYHHPGHQYQTQEVIDYLTDYGYNCEVMQEMVETDMFRNNNHLKFKK